MRIQAVKAGFLIVVAQLLLTGCASIDKAPGSMDEEA